MKKLLPLLLSLCLLLCACGQKSAGYPDWLPEEYADRTVQDWQMNMKAGSVTRVVYKVQEGKDLLCADYAAESKKLTKTTEKKDASSQAVPVAESKLTMSMMPKLAEALNAWIAEQAPERSKGEYTWDYIDPRVFTAETDVFDTGGQFASYSISTGKITVLEKADITSKEYGVVAGLFADGKGAWTILLNK